MHTYPILQRVSELYEGVGLSNVLLLSCQHLLDPQQKMFERLLGLGLKPENCVIVGKNYSTNDHVMQELIASGCTVAPFSNQFDPFRSFDDWFAEKLTDFIRAEILKRDMASYDKVIILDDGGFMHIVVNELCGQLPYLEGIEQTSSGHHRIKSTDVRFPVASVARSYHKLHYESPYIGRVGHQQIQRRMDALGIKNPRALIFGLGPIGRLIAGRLLLVDGIEGCVVDPKLEEIRAGKGDIASRGVFDLFRPEHHLPFSQLEERIGEFDLLIGCTGAMVLSEREIYRLHPRATLMSMSSSDREFAPLPFRKCGGDAHSDYVANGRTLANGGFPVTFDGQRHGMPPEQIELTISLLMTHVLHAASPRQLHLPAVVGQIHEMWKVQI